MPSHEFLKGMKGGRKQMWLSQHRDEVLAFFSQVGELETLKEYNLQPDTLRRLMRRGERRETSDGRLPAAERSLIISQAAIEGTRELRQRVNDLEERMAHVEPMMEFGMGMAVALQKLQARLLTQGNDFQQSRGFER